MVLVGHARQVIILSKVLARLEVESYEYRCGDGCCYDFGERLYVNGELVYDAAEIDTDAVIHTLRALGIESTPSDRGE